MSLVEFKHEEAYGADNGGNGMKKGGVYGGTITTAKVVKSDRDRRVSIELCIENTHMFNGTAWVPDVSTNNRMRIQIISKEGKEIFGMNKIRALLGMNKMTGTQEQNFQNPDGAVETYVVNLHKMKVAYSCFRKDRWYEEKVGGRFTGVMKLAYDFEHLHFFDVATMKTYSEMVDNAEPKAIRRPITDELVDPNNPPIAPSKQNAGTGGNFPNTGMGAGGFPASNAGAFPMNGGGAFSGAVNQPAQNNPFAALGNNVQQQVANDDAKNSAFVAGMQNSFNTGIF